MQYPNQECEDLDCIYNKRWRCLHAGYPKKWPNGYCAEYNPFWSENQEAFDELEELKENTRMTTSWPLALLRNLP